MNMVLLLGALSLMQATLTLPGIAGIVLTLGMAVDANVLIFERIREEVARGRTTFSAIENGFRAAFHTIVDSNLTTLIAAAILFYFGTGTIKGFAVTLSLGIMASMFTAIMLTRLMVVVWLKKTRHNYPDLARTRTMDITPVLTETAQLIQSYGHAGFKIAGEFYEESVLVFTGRCEPWEIRSAEAWRVAAGSHCWRLRERLILYWLAVARRRFFCRPLP